ncbi:MAG TPA: methyltransferase domain-containing protein [Gaiellaceae bacterium]|nr:methyltransferase domain-containing protein [Gaiellaceae bacterium]
MATVSVRYIVDDVDAAIAFYTERLGFREAMHPAPGFAMLSRGDLRLLLSAPSGAAGGGQALPDGTRPEPGGWNRLSLEVADLGATVDELRAAGARFRNEIVEGVGGRQILLEDPAGNPIELFEPTRPEAAFTATHGHEHGHEPPVASDVATFVRANLPPPPARVLEIGAGDGELARTLAGAGYDVLAIDPEPRGAGVRACALHELDEPPASFDAAVAVVSLHHVEPLAGSVARLADSLKPGAPLVLDELDVAALDRTAAAWWIEQRCARGADAPDDPDEVVAEHRAHLHPLERILEALAERFELGVPLRGAYLYRWHLDASLRPVEEELIARGRLPAVGARLLAFRQS